MYIFVRFFFYFLIIRKKKHRFSTFTHTQRLTTNEFNRYINSKRERERAKKRKQQQKMSSTDHHCTHEIHTYCYYLQCSESHFKPSGKPVPCNAEHGMIAYGRVNLSKCKA